ncbi:hypothetical protein HDE_08890 [Halotydeus destructor]|nr:hypothetical protein HDE_08890 [Halotydeus destructor]
MKDIKLGYTNKYSSNISDIVDKTDSKLLRKYWPDHFKYAIPAAPSCMDDFMTWAKGYESIWFERDTLRHLDLSRLETILAGWQNNYERRLLALKLIEVPLAFDDMAELLIRSGNAVREELCLTTFANARDMMAGLSWTPLDVSKYKDVCPKEAEACKEYERAFVDITEGSKQQMSPIYLRAFQKATYESMDAVFIEYDQWRKHQAVNKYVSKKDFMVVRPLCSLFPYCLWTSIDEEDVEYLNLKSPLVRTISLIDAIDNDLWSHPKEANAHNPWSSVQKFMAEGLSPRDAMIKAVHTRNNWMRSVELTYETLTEPCRHSIDKNLKMMVGWELFQSFGSRYGYKDREEALDLYWSDEKIKEWKADDAV